LRVAAVTSLKRDQDGKLKIAIAGLAELVAVSAAFQGRFKSM
jgi:hypothetical protein